MAVKPSFWALFAVFLAYPAMVVPHLIIQKRFRISLGVATTALGAIGGACALASFGACIAVAAAASVITFLSGFGRGRSGLTGSAISPARDVLHPVSVVQHHLTNGTVLDYLNFGELQVGVDHRVTVDGTWESTATRLETGHVRLSSKINQPPPASLADSFKLSLATRAALWARQNLNGILPRAGDDNPGDTGFIDVLFNDLDIGGTGLEDDGGSNSQVATQVGNAVGNFMISEEAESVCAGLINPNTNGEIIATEWFIRANDGTSGSTPSGACDGA